MIYTSETFKGSICENGILTNNNKEQLERKQMYNEIAIAKWNGEGDKEKENFFQDAKNLISEKLEKL